MGLYAGSVEKTKTPESDISTCLSQGPFFIYSPLQNKGFVINGKHNAEVNIA